jgi:AraC-like DNA-binding protein
VVGGGAPNKGARKSRAEFVMEGRDSDGGAEVPTARFLVGLPEPPAVSAAWNDAARVGFSSASHIALTFRRQTGESPSAFQRLRAR